MKSIQDHLFELKVRSASETLRGQKIQGKIDRVFGLITFFFILIDGYQYHLGNVNAYGLIVLHLYGFSNITTSALVRRFPQHTHKLESLRVGFFNQIFAALAMIFVSGILAPFWILYIINCCAIGPKWLMHDNRRTRIPSRPSTSSTSLFVGRSSTESPWVHFPA